MNLNNPKNSLKLYGLDDKINLLIDLYNLKKLPKTLILSGDKGIGKFTLVNHFLTYVFDKNYDLKTKKINNLSPFYVKYLSNVFQNIIYLNCSNLNIEKIRQLKSTVLKSSISDINRFIVFDDAELLNVNCSNALLKIIEEPTSNNFFILINNKQKPIIDTIISRCLEFKMSITNKNRIKIIDFLINAYNLDVCIDYKFLKISPGNFYNFNDICEKNKINLDDNYLVNLQIILNLYKKEKNINLINLISYITDVYFYKKSFNRNANLENIFEFRNYVFSNINKFKLLNINQTSLLNSLSSRLQNE